MAGCGRAILEYEAGELRFEVEDYYLHLKLTDNKMLIESSDTDSFELPLSPSEKAKVMESIDRISKEIKETNRNVIEIAKQILSLVEELFEIKQNELEELIRDGAKQFTQAVLSEGVEKIVEKVKADVKRCLAWYRIGESEKERIVNEYIERVRELVLDVFKEIKENERLYQKLVEHVEDGLWSRLF